MAARAARRHPAQPRGAGGGDMSLSPEAYAVIEGRHPDPFHYLGWHPDGETPTVRAYLPDAAEVAAIDEDGRATVLPRIHDAGLFAGPLASRRPRYRLRARFGNRVIEMEDPYRFAPVLSDLDLHLLGEGRHLRLYDKLGAHPMEMDGVHGVAFAVFAPGVRRVSVVGDFNFWDGCRHAMRVRGNGFWEIFVTGARAGDRYKYEIVSADGTLLPLKSDPVGFAGELRPKTASIVVDVANLPRPTPAPAAANALDKPISIYEVHLGSWRRKSEEGNRWLSYREVADLL